MTGHRTPRVAFLGLVAALAASTAVADLPEATLTRDINTATVGSSANPQGITAAFDEAYFSTANQQFWHSDGTASGTARVGTVSLSSIQQATMVAGTLYFVAAGGPSGGMTLWRSDGTGPGTVEVRPWASVGPVSPAEIVVLDDVLYFVANSSTPHGRELWRSDGTSDGTYEILDINPTASSNPHSLAVLDDKIYFFANDGVHGDELWGSDGTSAGTALVVDFVAGSNGILGGSMMRAGTQLFFSANGAAGYDLWRTDGTAAGTYGVKDINATGGADFSPLLDLGGTLLFFARDADHGHELWRSDGTEAGTVLVADLTPGPTSCPYQKVGLVAGSVAYIGSCDPSDSHPVLYLTDGTEEGTELVLAGTHAFGPPYSLTQVGDDLFFLLVPNDSGNLDELWKSDGTAAGTVLVRDMPGAVINGGLTAVDDLVFFAASQPDTGRELWVSDGTSAGTVLVTDEISDGGTDGSQPEDVTATATGVFFTAEEPDHRRELWHSDGSEAGTVLVRDIGPGSDSGFHQMGPVIGSTLFFWGIDSTSGLELWTSDGTEAGTQPVMDLYPGDGSCGVGSWAVFNGELYFTTCDLTHYGIFRSDGTEAGTSLVWEGVPSDLRIAGPRLFFLNSGTNPELWVSDGTPGGTSLVRELAPPLFQGGSMVAAGPLLFLPLFNSDTSLYELWRSDGSEPGTLKLAEMPGLSSLTAVGSRVYMTVYDGDESGLWTSDGTAAGTHVVLLPSAGGPRNPGGFVDLNGVAYFFAQNASNAIGLWRSDGTAAGTTAVYTPAAGGNWRTGPLKRHLGALYFTSNSGTQVWRSDGTTANTQQIATSTFANDITLSGARLFGQGFTLEAGMELMTLALPTDGFRVSPVTVDEDEGTATFEVTVIAAGSASVKYATVAGSAKAVSDYTTQAGTLPFPAGTHSQLVTVPILDDTLDEATESFVLRLSMPTGSSIAVADGGGTINDDDDAPSLSVSSPVVPEGGVGQTVNAVFSISLSTASGLPVAVTYATQNGGATAPADYTSKSATVTIPAGQLSKTVSVPVKGDTLYEPGPQTFTLAVTAATNASNLPSGVATITEDDSNPAVPSVSISDGAPMTEGGTTTFSVSLSEAAHQTVSVKYRLVAGTASSSDVGGASGTLTYLTGQSAKTITVTAVQDSINEPSVETFEVELYQPSGLSLGDNRGAASIADDGDPAPVINIGDKGVTEVTGNTVTAAFTVTLTAATQQPVTVTYQTADDSAIAPGDYTAKGPLVLTIAAGKTSGKINIPVKDDVEPESPEEFFVNLSGASANASIGDGQGVGTITSNE